VTEEHRTDEVARAELESEWQAQVEAQAEAGHGGEELDTHTVGQRRALREQIAGVTRRMEELRTHLDSLETAQRHRRQAAAMSPAVRNNRRFHLARVWSLASASSASAESSGSTFLIAYQHSVKPLETVGDIVLSS